MTNAPPLPDFAPITSVERADYLDPSYTGSWPALQKLRDGRTAVDLWSDGGAVYARAWERKDHPGMSALPPNAPRVVKALYRAEVQLRHMRSRDAFPVIRDIDLAYDAWERFHGA